MYCKHCGKQIKVDSQFCEYCGSQLKKTVMESSKMLEEDTPVLQMQKAEAKKQNISLQQQEKYSFSPSIVEGQDGIIRWSYGMSMWKNPTILITVWKVFMIGAMFPVLLVTFLTLFEDGLVEGFTMFFKMLVLMGGIMTGLVLIAYPIVAIMNGGSYQVVFELDSKGISHIQMEKQFKKNQVMAFITVLAGLASGNLQEAGAGLLAGTKQSSYSDFSKVQKIIANKNRHVIYVNESLQHNQVYVAKEDFDQVKAYIVAHCKKATLVDK